MKSPLLGGAETPQVKRWHWPQDGGTCPEGFELMAP